MDIMTMTETELKALAYEQFVLLQQTQNNISVIEQELTRRAKIKETEKEETQKDG